MNRLEKILLEDVKSKYNIPKEAENHVKALITKRVHSLDKKPKFLHSCKIKGFEKEKWFKDLKKQIRSDVYNMLRTYDIGNLEDIFGHLRQLLKNKILESKDHDKILRLHTSTRERLNDYERFYSRLKPYFSQRIIDLGCGLNPFSLPYALEAGLKIEEYIAVDVKKKYCQILEEYFSLIEKFGIKGRVRCADIMKSKVPVQSSDTVLMLKMVSLLDRLYSKEQVAFLLQSLKTRNLLLSCSRRSMVKKQAIEKREKKLLESYIKKCGMDIKKIVTMHHEIIYVCGFH